jgi:hypothetical protein
VLAEMGRSILALRNEAEAEHIWRESLRLAIEMQGTPVALEALAGLASLQAEEGDMEYALELLLMVLNHPASFQETKNRASDLRADLEAQLTPTQIEAIQTHAAEKTFEAVVEDLLKKPRIFFDWLESPQHHLRPILQRLRQIRGPDIITPRQLQDTVIGTRR